MSDKYEDVQMTNRERAFRWLSVDRGRDTLQELEHSLMLQFDEVEDHARRELKDAVLAANLWYVRCQKAFAQGQRRMLARACEWIASQWGMHASYTAEELARALGALVIEEEWNGLPTPSEGMRGFVELGKGSEQPDLPLEHEFEPCPSLMPDGFPARFCMLTSPTQTECHFWQLHPARYCGLPESAHRRKP